MNCSDYARDHHLTCTESRRRQVRIKPAAFRTVGPATPPGRPSIKTAGDQRFSKRRPA